MMLRPYVRMMLAACVLAATPSVVAAPQLAAVTSASSAPLNQTIPLDPRITTGTLPNGLRYYIRANNQPANRAELRLVVNAGALLEDDDQRGLAHFVEHMAFNGTLHFPKQAVVAFMQSIGMRFGAHVNAHTSFDETVYELQIPTDNPAVIDRALLALEDWAHNVTFDPVEIDKERGVILEEWRQGLGADARMQDKQFPVLLKGSRYADRLPIGKPEIIRSFTYAALKRFYTDWYRPDLMAVTAVGNFNPAAVEVLIKSRFGSIPAATLRKPKPAVDVPDHPGTIYAVTTDPEATNTMVSVYNKMAVRDQTTVGSYRQHMMERLFSGMLSARLDEIARRPNAPFLAAGTGRGLFVNAKEATTLRAIVAEDGIEGGLTALFIEADRVARFGFTATELDRERLDTRRGFERAIAEKDAQSSGALANEYIRNFTQREPIPGLVYEYDLVQRFLPQITLAEINGLARDWMPDRNRVIVVSAPQKAGLTVPTEAALAAVIKTATGGARTAYVDSVDARPLLDPLPAPGTIAKASVKGLGITEWTLSNGVRVVLEPTTFKQDEILFRATSPGGTSLASDQDFVAADTADRVVAEGGLGRLTAVDLRKALAGKDTVVRPEINEMFDGLRGGASRRDLETMFQLIYLTFTQPRGDPEAFQVMTTQLRAALANRQALPEAVFSDALEAAVTQHHLRARPLTPALINQMSLEKSLAFYKERFADASDFTFVFVGSFDLQTMRPLVERYLGSLPALHRNESGRDVGMRPPAGVVEQEVKRGIDPKSNVSIVFTGPFRNDRAHRMIARAMAESLTGNLLATLREDLGGTYSISVQSAFTKRPTESYRFTISFSCDPSRTDALVKAVFQVIADFKRRGPADSQVANTHAALLRDLETNMRQNSYLLDQIAFAYQYDEDVADVFRTPDFFDQLTGATMREAAGAYLDTGRYVEVILNPETR